MANDKGYDPMIAHAKTLGFTVKRQGHKARPASAAKSAAKSAAIAYVQAHLANRMVVA